ncbi:phospholipid carrier-dependent glycosyltransferase [Sinimarinibacterium thermocellulolyticum]|uniref:Polyprenol-phosphate-mannose--protein mannosyltransferase n=1 Tax=Sinimarinibacterium thermocellulolyticum TaxID=3170016 RepID=A0ABV2A8S3_9GAMM
MNTIAFVSLYSLLFLLVVGVIVRRRLAEVDVTERSLHPGWWWMWLAAGVLVRLPLLWDAGFHYDTGTYKAWALAASDPADLLGVYEDGVYTDHPPLLMYVLAVVGAIVRALGWQDSAHFVALLKLPALAADAMAALLLVGVLRETLGGRRALALVSLYWLNPALILVGALWGQTDGLLCLLLLAGALAWSRQHMMLAAIAFAAAAAFKPQGALFAAMFVVAAALSMPWRRALSVVAACVLAYAAVVVPFAWERGADWLRSLYTAGPGQADYITVNAYNLWALLGWNWQTEVGRVLGLKLQTIARIDAVLGVAAITVWLGLRLRRVADGAERRALISWAFVVATLAVFLLAAGMRERHVLTLIPFTLLLTPASARLPLMSLWSLAALANIAYVYHHYIDLKSIAPADTAFIRASASLNLLLGALTLWWWLQPDGPRRLCARFDGLRLSALPPPLPRDRWSARHSGAVAGLTLAALLIGLYRVGAMVYPKTGVVGDAFTVEYQYDEPVVAHIALIYAGEKALGETPAKLSLQRYADGEWIDVLPEREFNDFYHLYERKLVHPGASTRYRWRASGDDWRINELALLDLAGRALIPQRVVSTDLTPAEAVRLADETENWKAGRGYLASIYFDEIYHVRSGYEYLHRLPLYDHTHPPMGKWPIMLSIDALGMRPFGWRFVGVLTSAIIVGVLAWGGWLITGSYAGLLLAGGLGLFEFSRFTIGRYGTIDGYLALYLLLAVLLLWKRFGLEARADWRDGWRPGFSLIAAGAFLGAAIGVKWSALYGGLGVFVFFLVSVSSGLLRDGAQRWRRLWPRVAGAGLAFALVPLTVFCLSYIPFLKLMPGSPSLFSADGVREIIKSQQYIYSYHANLTASHPFASAFWTWPINLKPLWIYTGEGQPRTAISILGNPAIWWGGLIALIAAVWRNLRQVHPPELMLILSWASLFLPWALVERAAFNYHYFPSALLLVLLLAHTLLRLSRWPRLRLAPIHAVALAGVLFVWFYPTISGHPAPDAWFKSLRWLPTWWML